MAGPIKDTITSLDSNKKRLGFLTGVLVVVSILTGVEYSGVIEFREPTKEIWVSESEFKHVLGFPNYQNPDYKLYFKSIGEYGGSVLISAEKKNAWHYEGIFYIGDTVLLEEYRVTIKEINLDKEDPIGLEYYRLVDLTIPLIIAIVILGILVYDSWRD